MVDLQAKIWGITAEIFRNNSCSVHFLEVKKDGFCSEHRHAKKENAFFIIEGVLEISEWRNDILHVNCISSGQMNPRVTIPTGHWHKFRAVTDVKCIEIYNFKYDGEDIERRTIGGCTNG